MSKVLTLILLALAMASPAGAQQKSRTTVVPKITPALRGSQSAVAPPVAAAAQSLFLPQPLSGPQAGVGAGQCRLSCAQSYYFCLSTEGAEDCGSNWGQCRARCDVSTPVASALPG